jgi:DNA-binding MarR family transcriptional regulator
MSQKSGTARPTGPHRFTEKQGHYLAFIYVYSRIFRQAPAEADMQRHFLVTPPSVHQMVLTLERAGLIRPAPQEASKSLSHLRTCLSSNGSTSTRH